MSLPFLRFVALAASLAGLAGACNQPPPPPPSDTTSGSGSGSSTAPVGTTFSAPASCEGSEDCEEGAHCVAPYDPGVDPPMGPGACVEACIEADDLGRWCFDDDACCGDLRCREVDGFCEPLSTPTDDGTGSSGSSTSDVGTSGDTETTGTTSTGSTTSTGGSSGTSTG